MNIKNKTDFKVVNNNSKRLIIFSTGLTSNINDNKPWTKILNDISKLNKNFNYIRWSPRIISQISNKKISNFNFVKTIPDIYLPSIKNLVNIINEFRDIEETILIGFSFGCWSNAIISEQLQIKKMVNISLSHKTWNFFNGFYGRALKKRGVSSNALTLISKINSKKIDKFYNHKFQSEEIIFYQPETDKNVHEILEIEQPLQYETLNNMDHQLMPINKDQHFLEIQYQNWETLLKKIFDYLN